MADVELEVIDLATGQSVGKFPLTLCTSETLSPYNVRFDFLTVAAPPKPKGTIATHATLTGII